MVFSIQIISKKNSFIQREVQFFLYVPTIEEKHQRVQTFYSESSKLFAKSTFFSRSNYRDPLKICSYSKSEIYHQYKIFLHNVIIYNTYNILISDQYLYPWFFFE